MAGVTAETATTSRVILALAQGVDTHTCQTCGRTKPLSSFGFNRKGTTPRARCRACRKEAYRRKRGVRSRVDMQRVAQERALEKAARRVLVAAPRSNVLRDHPDPERGRLYRNALFRAKYARDVDAERERVRVYKHAKPEQAEKWNGVRAERARVTSDGTLTQPVIRALLRAATECAYCECALTPRTRSLDHVIPLARGGAHSIANVVVACRDCNHRKSGRLLADWLDVLREIRRERARRAA